MDSAVGCRQQCARMSTESNPAPCLAVVATNLMGGEGTRAGGAPFEVEDVVAEMMKKLNLTTEEATTVILEDENEEDLVSLD